MWKPAALSLALVASPAGLVAHPHIFVDATVTLELDDEHRITGVEVTWVYDDFFTLLILEDMGLDADADGVLSDAELGQLRGFDLEEWPEGFEGDLYLSQGEERAAIGLPQATGIAVEDGKIVASHRREVDPFPADGTLLEAYDPTFYVAYELRGVRLPEACRAPVQQADPEAADARVAEMVEDDSLTERSFETLEIGHLYADRALISCAGSS
ncbi:MAG: DUF1007 family protein [Paracoccaceae bacterium]